MAGRSRGVDVDHLVWLILAVSLVKMTADIVVAASNGRMAEFYVRLAAALLMVFAALAVARTRRKRGGKPQRRSSLERDAVEWGRRTLLDSLSKWAHRLVRVD